MSTLLEPILMILRDGCWHSFEEVQEHSGYYELKTAIIIDFLSKFGFVDLKKKKKEVKLSPSMVKFITEIEKLAYLGHQDL